MFPQDPVGPEFPGILEDTLSTTLANFYQI